MKQLLLILLSGICLAQLPVKYNMNIASDSIAIRTIADPEFPWIVKGFNKRYGDPDLSPILPLVVYIRNVGQKRIGYVNVRYTYTLSDGDHSGYVTYDRNPILGDQFSPGQEIILHPAIDTVGNHVTATNLIMLNQLIDLMQRSSKITISTDAVTLEDGSLIGEDKGGIGRKYKLEREAVEAAYLESIGRAHKVPEDEWTYNRVLEYSKRNAKDLKEMLDRFAPLKGELQ